MTKPPDPDMNDDNHHDDLISSLLRQTPTPQHGETFWNELDTMLEATSVSASASASTPAGSPRPATRSGNPVEVELAPVVSLDRHRRNRTIAITTFAAAVLLVLGVFAFDRIGDSSAPGQGVATPGTEAAPPGIDATVAPPLPPETTASPEIAVDDPNCSGDDQQWGDPAPVDESIRVVRDAIIAAAKTCDWVALDNLIPQTGDFIASFGGEPGQHTAFWQAGETGGTRPMATLLLLLHSESAVTIAEEAPDALDIRFPALSTRPCDEFTEDDFATLSRVFQYSDEEIDVMCEEIGGFTGPRAGFRNGEWIFYVQGGD